MIIRIILSFLPEPSAFLSSITESKPLFIVMKTLVAYFKKRKEAITNLLEKPRHLYTRGTFHQLRIEIKKYKALINLTHFCSKDFKQHKNFKPFKRLFRQAGKIRDLQLEEAMLKKLDSDHLLCQYYNNLKKKRLKEQGKFFLMVHKKFKTILKKKYSAIASFLVTIHPKKTTRYIRKKRKNLKKLLIQGELQPQQFHGLRKQLNSLKYNLKCLSVKHKNNFLFRNSNLPALIGQWHDAQVMIKRLEKAIHTGGINPEELSQLEKIKTKIVSDEELLFHKIKDILRILEPQTGQKKS